MAKSTTKGAVEAAEPAEASVDFKSLDSDELKELAEFFAIDVLSAKPEPTHEELVLSFQGADEPVTIEDYETFKTAKETNQVKSQEVLDEEAEFARAQEQAEPVEEVDKSDWVLVRFVGKNPTLEIVGFRFSSRSPFGLVPPEVAEYLIAQAGGFRQALPSELQDYYN